MVRMAGLIAATRDEPAERRDDGLSPGAEVAAVSEAVASIAVRQAECFDQCRRAMESLGARVATWEALSDADRAVLADRFRDDIQPLLTPFAMTLSPGHPLPRLGHLTLSMAVILRQRAGGPPRFAELELPSSLPRFLTVSPSQDERTIVPIEEVIRGNLGLLYPDATVEHAYAFRVTRSAEIELDEEHADDLLEEVARATTSRGQGIAVRVEVERGMPAIVRALLLENVRREQAAVGAPPLPDVDEVDGLLDLRGLVHLDLPARAKASYPPFTAGRPFGDAGVFATLGARDVLAHHPFDSFGETVVRFLRDAAADPDVAAIKITLYRIGNPSAIADALLSAAKAGKAVTVFVELKARFDEEINVGWARALEAAGGHVVRGIVGFKNHAKVALVVRRDERGRAATVRSHRHGELQHEVGRAVHGPEPVHHERPDRGRRRGSVQRADRRVVGAAAREAGVARRAAASAAGHRRADRPRGRACPRRASGRDHGESQRPFRSRRRARPLPRVERRRGDRPRRSRDLHAPAGDSRAQRARASEVRSSAVSSSTRGSIGSRTEDRRATSSARPTFVRETFDDASRCSCRSTTRISAAVSTRSSRSISTTPRRGSFAPTGATNRAAARTVRRRRR